MGNCQTAEAAAVVIQHPNGRVQRLHWSVTASQVMGTNPGHYVAVIVTARATSESKAAVRYLKLLRPDDTLLIGQVYRLISFEDVLREFGSKRRVRLSRLPAKQKEAAEGGEGGGEDSRRGGSSEMADEQQREALEDVTSTMGASGVNGRGSGVLKQGQWRPTLQTIAEIGN